MTKYAVGKEKIFQRPTEETLIRLKDKSLSRGQRNIAIMGEIKNLIGDDIPWTTEEEMIQELAETRRRNSKR